MRNLMFTLLIRNPIVSVAFFVLILGGCSQVNSDLQDSFTIQQALTHYSYRWDSKDSSGFADLFTTDGVMERRANNALIEGSRVAGREEILSYARNAHEGRLSDRQTRHHFSQLLFLELGGDAAVTENMALITHQLANNRPTISSSGIYRITWSKIEGNWLIKERVLFTDSFDSSQ